MSLLLDALKKAAEQKAQKSQEELAPDRHSDETVLDVSADSIAHQAASDEGDADPADDETEFDQSQIGVRLDRTGRLRDAGDDTGIEPSDATEHRLEQAEPLRGAEDDTGLDLQDATSSHIDQQASPRNQGDETALDIADAGGVSEPGDDAPGAQMQTEQDESIVFAAEDATNFVVESESVELPPGAGEDETDLSQLTHNKPLGRSPESNEQAPENELKAEDETDLSELEVEEDRTGHGEQAAAGVGASVDETDISRLPRSDDADALNSDVEADPVQPQMSAEVLADDLPPGSDDTDISQPSSFADQIAAAQVQQQPEDSSEARVDLDPGVDVIVDEDLSLMLIEPELINPELDADSSFTDSQIPQDRDAAHADRASGIEELSLQDNTETRNTGARILGRSDTGEQTDTQGPTLTSPTATAVYADDTRTTHSAPTIPRGDATSTRTYAPDNYDRTLMKLPSDDASKIFAGMKSDSDVVMTPDYAKKVFRSKTSAQQVQHYKLYAGIAVVIVLSVSIYGIFQYQDESEQIDDSLRALKRDPMPGVIKAAQPEKTELFAETEVLATARTIEIIETANQVESIPEAETSVTQSQVVDEMSAAQEETASSETEVVASGLPAQVESPTNQATNNQDDSDQLARLDSPVSSAPESDVIRKESAQAGRQSNMQITTSNEYRQADIWLGEAYAAYRVGDNKLALARYDQVLDVDPANRNALLARAAIRMQDGQIESAIKDYQALLLANPTDSQAMSSLLAVADYSPRETESQLKLMIRNDPQSPYLNFALANAYGAQKRWREAQRHYFTALQNNPDDPNYAYNLAVSLEHISQPSSAITYYQRALDNFTNGLATFNRDIVNQRLEILGQL